MRTKIISILKNVTIHASWHCMYNTCVQAIKEGIEHNISGSGLQTCIELPAHMSTPSQEAENQAPVPATPDDNGGAEAAAEVAAMGLADARGQVAEQMNGDFELIDESGELVKSRFLSFLMN